MRLLAMAAVLLSLGGTAHASAAEKLGDAFRAYDAGDVDRAAKLLDDVRDKDIVNVDYLHWLRGQVALLRGRPREALTAFQTLAKDGSSAFAGEAPWRIADCQWELGQKSAAATAYAKLLAGDGAARHADLAEVRLRIAEAAPARSTRAALREVLLEHPAHPAARTAEARLVKLGDADLSADDRIRRAVNLLSQHLWHEAVAELALVPEDVPPGVWRRRTYWLGETLFKMRRRYGDAGELLLSVWDQMGSDSAEALFHGARGLSRADRDDEAIGWYKKVVQKFPNSGWAEEAQYLTGWLEFNRGNYKAAIAPLEQMVARYPKSKWADDAVWFLGMARYLLGKYGEAQRVFDKLAQRGGSLVGGKGRYWRARTQQKLGNGDPAAEYKAIVARWPFSWYALLSRARLAEMGVTVGPFGARTPAPRGAAIATAVDESLAGDPVIRSADELIAAGLETEAGEELARGERAFLKRHDRAAGLRLLMDRYARAHDHHRPYQLAEGYGGEALDGPAEGRARVWWEYAYPQAYAELVDKYESLGDCPDYYLYSIMRKESGFTPNDISYADAQGLLQMIPPTTERVARHLGIEYDPGDLYEPEFNIQTGAWYIGHLLAKFKGQIPIGAGSFNSGPRPVMKWLDKNGDRPIDELVELVSYNQTREYMKKVTENYARYVYLYDGVVYEQPLSVDKAYLVDDLTY